MIQRYPNVLMETAPVDEGGKDGSDLHSETWFDFLSPSQHGVNPFCPFFCPSLACCLEDAASTPGYEQTSGWLSVHLGLSSHTSCVYIQAEICLCRFEDTASGRVFGKDMTCISQRFFFFFVFFFYKTLLANKKLAVSEITPYSLYSHYIEATPFCSGV